MNVDPVRNFRSCGGWETGKVSRTALSEMRNGYRVERVRIHVGSGTLRKLAQRAGHDRRANPRRVESLESRLLLATFAVNTFADEIDLNPGNGVVDTTSGHVSLRAAVMEANALSGEDTITLGAGTHNLSIDGSYEEAGETGDLDILGDLIITGSAGAVISANGFDRIFDVHVGISLEISGLTLRDGVAKGNPDVGSLHHWGGGAILVDTGANLSVSDCLITGNIATELNRSGDGGAITVLAATLTMTRSTVSSNTSTDQGGALHVNGTTGTMTITDSTLSGNRGGYGGAVSVSGGASATMTNCTFSGNRSDSAPSTHGGGAIHIGVDTTMNLLNCTLANNTRGATALNDIQNAGGTYNIRNSILASGVGQAGVPTVVNSLGNNIYVNVAYGSGFVASDLIDVNPKLSLLGNNGGPTQTFLPLLGSPAIGGANSSEAPAFDQRGVSRPQGTDTDIGAVEVDSTSPSVVSGSFEYQTAHSINIQFSENVYSSLGPGELLVRPVFPGGSMGPPIGIVQMEYDFATNTATFPFPTWLSDGNYRATLAASAVTDIAGNHLDHDFTLDFYFLGGDITGDRKVDMLDLIKLATNWKQSGKTFNDGDFNYDTVVDASDLAILASRWQQYLGPVTIPELPLASGAAARTSSARPAARTPVRVVGLVQV